MGHLRAQTQVCSVNGVAPDIHCIQLWDMKTNDKIKKHQINTVCNAQSVKKMWVLMCFLIFAMYTAFFIM